MNTTNPTLANLSTPDLLNLIDQLQEIGIGDEIKLPQIIVVGSQSSGKSSVLEAISRLSFPRGQGLTTTFATEIALRKSEEVSISARIIFATETQRQAMPAHYRPQHPGVSSWTRTLTELNPEDVAALVNDAREVIEQNSTRGPMSFSFDKLRIEASGPDFPLLTLIDLPGLILTPNDNQTKQDVQDVEKIVKSYMENNASLMLAIITAETELVNQRALELAAEYDPKGSRTIGVITKPDLLPPGHPNIRYLVQCAQGEIEQRRLALGWFVLKNRNFDMAGLSAEERDTQEEEFFRAGEWSSVGSHRTGVSQLRDNLSKLQEKAARAALPYVIEQLDSKLSRCQIEHEKLGPARVDEKDQRFYLDKTASTFSIMVQQAVKGDYMDRGFFNGGDPDEPRQLRAVLEGLYRDFLDDMTTNGRTWVLVQDDAAVLESRKSHSVDQNILTMEQMFEKIQKLHQARRGMSLEGMVNQYPLVASLFEEQSEKWESIARRHVKRIYDAILKHLYLVVDYLASKDTALKIQSELIRKPMVAKQKQVIDKVKELVAPYQKWRPLTMNPMYGEFVYKVKADILQSVPNIASTDLIQKQAMEQYALVLNHLETYYLTAVTIFIDNVIILAVEMMLLKDLHEVFNSSTVLRLDMRKLNFVAAEPIEEKQIRDRIINRLDKLERAKRVCDDYQHGILGINIERSATPDLTSPSDPLSPTPLQAPKTPADISYLHTGSPKAPQEKRGRGLSPIGIVRSYFEVNRATDLEASVSGRT